MKTTKKIILFTLLLLSSLGMYAQKFAYVDTDYILNKIVIWERVALLLQLASQI